MCDTMVALGNSTASGQVLFAKNSDREANEAQALEYYPARDHVSGSTVKATYLELPQARRTRAILLCRPFWMWGGEAGVNDAGVAIGNQAVFTRLPVARSGLLGMDLLRLALERAGSAAEAVEVLISLLETHGQGGACAYFNPKFTYHNAFLVADAREAFVLETADRHWALEQVRTVRSISNGLSIRGRGDRCSRDLVKVAVEKGWCRREADFDFAACYGDPLYTWAGAASRRQCRVTDGLKGQEGRLSVWDMRDRLIDHGPETHVQHNPRHGLRMQVCAHAAWGPLRGGGMQTTASLIAALDPNNPALFATGTSAPCLSLFKPLRFPRTELEERLLLQALGPSPRLPSHDDARWWKHERFHRAVLRDYPTRRALIHDELEAAQRSQLQTSPPKLTMEDIAHHFEVADRRVESWTKQVIDHPVQRRGGWLYHHYWRRRNREAGHPD